MRLAYCLAPPLLAAAGAASTYHPAGVRLPWAAEDPAAVAAGLDRERQSAGERLAERRRVGADLAAGRLTLAEAADRMAELNRDVLPATLADVRHNYPRATPEAVAHWQAVRYAGRADPAAFPGLAADHRRRFPEGPDPDFPSPPMATAGAAAR